MAKGQIKQHVPIFVGSTFEDLKQYREAVRNSLHRLETIVRGMEYFGSKPGSPLDECLAAVRSCKVYVGIFAMRYGSIPDNYELSMTHLEYEEAQKLGLPSLIYIIDEQNQPILPKYVETGGGAEKLRKFKEHLKKHHMVSFFTNEDDLAGKILHDLPPVLEKAGTKIEGTLETGDMEESIEILRRFEILPQRWRGKEVVISFVNERDFRSTSDEAAGALDLDIGGSISAYLKIGKNPWRIYGEGDIAEQLIDLEKDMIVKARAVTVFGVEKRADYTDEGSIQKKESVKGLLIKEIISVTPVSANSD